MMPGGRVQRVLDEIDQMTINEVALLRSALIDKWGSSGDPPDETGVREPRRPRPSVGGAAAKPDKGKEC